MAQSQSTANWRNGLTNMSLHAMFVLLEREERGLSFQQQTWQDSFSNNKHGMQTHISHSCGPRHAFTHTLTSTQLQSHTIIY